MIVRNAQWFDVVPSDGKRREIDGKWLIFGPTAELHRHLEQLDALVEAGEIKAAMVTRKVPSHDLFPEKPCVICVFTADDPAEKAAVKALLQERLGLTPSSWKSDAQTRKDWEEKGWLRLQAEAGRLRREIYNGTVGDADAARERLFALTAQISALSATADDEDRRAEFAGRLAHDVAAETRAGGMNVLSFADVLQRLDRIERAIQSHAETPKTGPASAPDAGHRIFVIMPFAEPHVDTYAAIQRAARRAREKAVVHRVDEQPGAVVVTDEIHRAISEAAIVVCDLTDERPNVYYELGVARGVQRPLVCIAREGTRVHFDVAGLRILYFSTYHSLEERLAREFDQLLPAEAAAS
ncbi:MAG TPA: hypothetical protein VFS20_29280 [Longimicrobium sp.]|nr:hypothetical protein [Longimicrobium sp.]